jgi:hypothetical protein
LPAPLRCYTRRHALSFALGAPAAWAALALGAGYAQEAQPEAASDAPQCPSDDSMRISLNYVDVSPHGAERDCRNCEFWVAQQEGASCGGCTLIDGPISPLAYCDSWALMPTSAQPAS